MAIKRINVTTTAYQGDAPFPEAEHYPEFVAEKLAERYGAEVDCTGGGLQTQVNVYGFGEFEAVVEHEVSSLVKVELWDEFCANGYKAYSAKSAPTAASGRAQHEVVEAIGRSISHNEIVHLPWTQEREDELTALAGQEGGDSVDTGEVYEFWGAAGNAWRVHLDREVVDNPVPTQPHEPRR